jgi:hypothetical protein
MERSLLAATTFVTRTGGKNRKGQEKDRTVIASFLKMALSPS